MSSITYNGHSFGDYVSTELVEPAAHVVATETARVPGRPGLVLLSANVEPIVLKVRLFLDAPDALTVAQRAEVRRTLRAWLLTTSGAELVAPGEPELTWLNAVCTDVSDWTSLFADGQAVVTFECLDPIAYGSGASSSEESFALGGTWETWPVIELVTDEGSSVSVGYAETESSLVVERTFAAGDAVVIDCLAQTVTVNGDDATADVTLGSDFFALRPGDVSLAFSGCSTHTVTWTERWA